MATPLARVARWCAFVPDVAACSSFYATALGLRVLREVPGRVAVLGGGGVGCEVMFRASEAARDRGEDGSANGSGSADGSASGSAVAAQLPPQILPAPALRYPFLTFGVSNLKTSSRHAGRSGGAVLPAAAGSQPSASEAVFVDPAGRCARVLHLYRRQPTLSVTLGVEDVAASASFFEGALGLRRAEGPEEEAEAHARQQDAGSSWLALAFAPRHTVDRTWTRLVLEQRGAFGATAPEGDAGRPLLALEVPDVHAARGAFLARGLPASPIGGAAGGQRSFTALCPDGYTFHVWGGAGGQEGILA